MLEAHIRLSLADPVTILFVSDGIEALLGFKLDDFLTGKVSFINRVHAHDQDIADDLFSTEVNKTSGTFNFRLRQSNGRIRCIKGHYTKELDAPGMDVILELHLQDAKSLWQGLGDQPMTANFKAMMENTDDYIYFKDRNHVFSGASQTLVAITAPSEHWTDLLGQTDYDVFPEEYADVYYLLEKQVFAGMPVAHEIQETLDNDGNKGWVDNRKYPITNGDGEIIGLFGIARDITEQKLAELALRESEARFRAIIEATPVPLALSDEQGNITYLNKAFLQTVGYTTDDISTLTDWWPRAYPDPQYRQWVADSWQNNLEEIKRTNNSFSPIEVNICCKDGLVRTFMASAATLVSNFSGTHLVILYDITERKLAENELRIAAAALE